MKLIWKIFVRDVRRHPQCDRRNRGYGIGDCAGNCTPGTTSPPAGTRTANTKALKVAVTNVDKGYSSPI